MKYIDLHVHSNISDGSCTPEEVIALAKKKNLAAVTLTDHESIAGNKAAAEAAAKLGVEFIPGMEMSVDYAERRLHIVSLGFDAENPTFKKLYKKIRFIKESKMDELISGIQEHGVAISRALVAPFVINHIDRYAIMRYLVSLHLYDHAQPIWDYYINPVVAKLGLSYNVTAAEALPVIHEAGGVTSLAHFHKKIGLGDLNRAAQEAVIVQLKSLGLDGMEQYYPNYTDEDAVFAQAMIDKYDLIPTGGTDFHGTNRPEIDLGTGLDNNIKIPYSFYEAIEERCAK
ncbi:MAG: PHP domain-containing protein [Selenomonadaceae bacterium]